MKTRFYTIILSLITGGIFAQPAFIKDSLDKFIEREMKRWNVPGLAIAIVKDTQVITMKGYGFADLDKKTKVNENTLFQIASNSKAFTATALCMLERQEKLSINDKAKQWIPYFKLKDQYVTENATIADLLSHKIGFQTFQGDFLNWGCNLTRKQIIENLKNLTPEFTFREEFGYCNAAFLTAGEIIPAACDTSWDDFLQHRIFTPLNMSRTSTKWNKIEQDENACKPYTIYNGKLVQLARVNVDNLGPAASINSSVKDLSNWLLMQINNGKFNGKQIVPSEALYKTRQPFTISGEGRPSNKNYFELYGLGWFMKDYHGSKIIWHDGGADGFVTTTCFLPGEKIGITVLTNTDAGGFYSILRDMIIDAYLNLPYKNKSADSFSRSEIYKAAEEKQLKSWREQADKKEKWQYDLSKLEGTYKNEFYGNMTIKKENGTMRVLFQNHPLMSAQLEYMNENKFLCTYSSPTWGIQTAEVTIEKNKVKGITVKVNDFVDYMSYYFVKQ